MKRRPHMRKTFVIETFSEFFFICSSWRFLTKKWYSGFPIVVYMILIIGIPWRQIPAGMVTLWLRNRSRPDGQGWDLDSHSHVEGSTTPFQRSHCDRASSRSHWNFLQNTIFPSSSSRRNICRYSHPLHGFIGYAPSSLLCLYWKWLNPGGVISVVGLSRIGDNLGRVVPFRSTRTHRSQSPKSKYLWKIRFALLYELI